MFGDEERDVLVQAHGDGLGLFLNDGDAHLLFWRLDAYRKAPGKARFKPLLYAADVLGVSIAGDYYLLVRLDQRVECVEELFLGTVLAAEELNVVDQQQIERMVVALEFVERLLMIGAHHVGDVLCRMQITHFGGGVLRQNVIAHSMDQVSLA